MTRRSRQLCLISLLVLLNLNPVRPQGKKSLIPPKWNDENGKNDLSGAEATLDGAFSDVLENGTGGGKTERLIKPFPIEELYFHEDGDRLSVTVEDMRGLSALQFEPVIVDTVLPEQRADLELILETLRIEGRYKVDRQAFGDFDSREEGLFVMTLSNVTAIGLATLHIDGSTLSVNKILLEYKPEEVHFKVNREVEDPGLWRYTSSDRFGEIVREKIWRSVTHHLNRAVKERLRTVLAKKPMSSLVADEETQKKLQKYVIETTESANEFVDNIITAVRKMIRDKYEDKVKIPDIREGFERTVVLRFHGSFVADQGSARGLTTVYRNGETTFGRDNASNVHFYGNIGFDDINLYYDHYTAEFMGLGPSGTINTQMVPLELNVHIHVDFEKDRVFLDKFKVESVGDLEVEVTGLGFLLNWLSSRIGSWVIGMYRDQFLDQLEARYDDYISTVLDGYSLQDIMNGTAFK